LTRSWTCSRCGEVHTGLPAIAFDRPLPWDELTEPERNASVLEPDTCEIHSAEGDYYYVRGSFEIPIRDAEGTLEYGVWGSLSHSNFERFVELYDDPSRLDEPAYSSWFGNRLPGFPDTLNLRAWVEIYDIALRPRIVLHEQEHALVDAVQNGIDLAQAIALVEPLLQ
jgi:hypothetical protein